MNQELLERLGRISPEEEGILAGDGRVQKSLYTSENEFIVDSRQMLDAGKLIDIRPHTRFVHFPRHRHNYIEIIYMCSGTTTHIINENTRLVLETGDLLFLNQQATQEILPAGNGDIAVNFIVLPEFFDTAFSMISGEENMLKTFLVDALCGKDGEISYLHFHVAGILPVQNLVENMVWTLLNNLSSKRSINQTTMGLLILHLTHHTDRIRSGGQSYDQQLIFQVLRYIDENYRDGELGELAAMLGYDVPWLSRAIKRLLGRTYKELLQVRRLNQAAFLLQNTRLPITDICAAVGYDNTSYFHRIFRGYYHMSPREYRLKSLSASTSAPSE